MQDWEFLKKNIYYEDGSLRDIYIHNITKGDWTKWVDVINTNFKISFFDYTNVVKDKIDIQSVFDYWGGKNENICHCSIFIGSIKIQTCFFAECEIESSIYPKDVRSIEDHEKLVTHLQSISKVLHKRVILTHENFSALTDPNLIVVDKNSIFIEGSLAGARVSRVPQV